MAMIITAILLLWATAVLAALLTSQHRRKVKATPRPKPITVPDPPAGYLAVAPQEDLIAAAELRAARGWDPSDSRITRSRQVRSVWVDAATEGRGYITPAEKCLIALLSDHCEVNGHQVWSEFTPDSSAEKRELKNILADTPSEYELGCIAGRNAYKVAPPPEPKPVHQPKPARPMPPLSGLRRDGY